MTNLRSCHLCALPYKYSSPSVAICGFISAVVQLKLRVRGFSCVAGAVKTPGAHFLNCPGSILSDFPKNNTETLYLGACKGCGGRVSFRFCRRPERKMEYESKRQRNSFARDTHEFGILGQNSKILPTRGIFRPNPINPRKSIFFGENGIM